MKAALPRRTFSKTAMGVPLAVGVAGISALAATSAGGDGSRALVGIHIAAHSLYDERIDLVGSPAESCLQNVSTIIKF